MPKDESLEKQQSQGLPGIHVPKNAGDIKEFSEARNIPADKFNEQMQKLDEVREQAKKLKEEDKK